MGEIAQSEDQLLELGCGRLEAVRQGQRQGSEMAHVSPLLQPLVLRSRKALRAQGLATDRLPGPHLCSGQ